MSRVTLATNSAGFEQRVRRAFAGSLNGELQRWRPVDGTDIRRAVADLTRDGADVVAFGPDVHPEQAFQVAREFDRFHPEIAVLVVAPPTPETWEAALKAGVRDVIDPDVSDDELRQALENAVEITERRRRNIAKPDDGPGAAGRVICVVAPKGGSGKTAIATNLGVVLAQAAPDKVALVDLDLQFGDITPCLGLEPETTIIDFMRNSGRETGTALKVLLTKRTGGLYVLCAPESPAEGEQVTEATVHRAVSLLAEEFPYVVVDTAAGLNEHTLAALELATDVVFVADLSAVAVRGLRKVVLALDQLGMSPQRTFVINRADSKVGVQLTEVATALGHAVDLKLPSTRHVPRSMNEGAPLAESAPKSAYARRIADLAARLVPEMARPRHVRWRRAE